jgi:hypothetical protein
VLYPQPDKNAVGINEPATIDLDPGERGTVTYETQQRISEIVLPVLAISKYAGCVYEVRADGQWRYGPAEIPPTDIDDLSVCFLPALRFETSLTIQITNLGSTGRTINVQPIGWEPVGE